MGESDSGESLRTRMKQPDLVGGRFTPHALQELDPSRSHARCLNRIMRPICGHIGFCPTPRPAVSHTCSDRVVHFPGILNLGRNSANLVPHAEPQLSSPPYRCARNRLDRQCTLEVAYAALVPITSWLLHGISPIRLVLTVCAVKVQKQIRTLGPHQLNSVRTRLHPLLSFNSK